MRRQPQERSWPGPALSPPGHSFPARRSIASWLLPTPSLVSFLLILQVLCGQDIHSDCLGRAPPISPHLWEAAYISVTDMLLPVGYGVLSLHPGHLSGTTGYDETVLLASGGCMV